MRYLSVCSGIEAATQAWHPLGWEPVAFSEIEPFPCKVLAHHYPAVPNLGDMTKFKEWPDAKIDVLVGGTPCQSFSVAGLRKGLDDPRGNLMLTYLAIADKYKPTWIVWENVPGVLSSNGGKDFGTFLGALGELGYGFAYRVLDAQFVRTDGHPYAVPQRRRRVFVVGCLGDWGRAAAVLFDSESLRGNPPPSRGKGQEVAGAIGIRTGVGCEFGPTGGRFTDVNATLDTRAKDGPIRNQLGSAVLQPVCMSHGQANAEICEGYAPTLNCNHEQPIAFALAGNTIGRAPANGGNHTGFDDTGSCYTLTKTDVHAVAYSFDSMSSNSMKSSNPVSGCNKVEVCKTLDTSRGLDPSCNQGGIAVAFQLAGDRDAPSVSVSPELAFCLPANPMSDRSQAVAYRTNAAGQVNPQDGIAAALNTQTDPCAQFIAYDIHGTPATNVASTTDVHTPLRARVPGQFENSTVTVIQSQMQVRRLTPTECERLQAFPDGFTNIPGASDSARYKALGNSMAVNVMQLIGERIQYVEDNT